jgi:hypothetical protein
MYLKVITHSGIDDTVEVLEYDPVKLNADLNSNEIQTVLIGKNIYSRIDIKYVSEVTAP